MNKLRLIIGGIALVVLGLLTGGKLSNGEVFGSVSQASEYHSTSTTWVTGANTYYLKTDSGVIGSVVITSSSGQIFTVSDADGSTTSTITEFKAGAGEGTYTLDINAYNGIAITVPAGHNGHFITTYR